MIWRRDDVGSPDCHGLDMIARFCGEHKVRCHKGAVDFPATPVPRL
jgi:hypothetical protein